MTTPNNKPVTEGVTLRAKARTFLVEFFECCVTSYSISSLENFINVERKEAMRSVLEMPEIKAMEKELEIICPDWKCKALSDFQSLREKLK